MSKTTVTYTHPNYYYVNVAAQTIILKGNVPPRSSVTGKRVLLEHVRTPDQGKGVCIVYVLKSCDICDVNSGLRGEYVNKLLRHTLFQNHPQRYEKLDSY